MEEKHREISALAVATKIAHVIHTRGTRAFWAEVFPWLMNLSRSDAISLIYIGHRTLQLREGTLSAEIAAYLAEWESQWLTRGHEGDTHTLSGPAMIIHEHRTSDGQHVIHFPLQAEGRSLGSLALIYTRSEHVEHARHPTVQALIRAFGHLAYIQDLLQYSQERLEQVSLFYQIGQSLASSLDLGRVLRETIELTTVILDAEAATLFLLDEEKNELIFAIPTGEKQDILREFRIPVGQGLAGWVVQTGQSVLVNDVQSDPRFLRQVDSQTGFTTRNVVCVPLQYQGRITGALETINKRGAVGFTEEDLQWLTTLATQAAIAIENARLYESLRQERDKIIAVQEEVRHRLARALHDGPAQKLARLLLDIDYARKLLNKHPESIPTILDEMEDTIRRTNREIRQLLFELRPVILETRGLVAALQMYIERWQESENIACYLEARDFPADLDTKAAGIIFSILQEAFNNIRKHAQAQTVWVRLQRNDGQLEIEVEDDGKGFDVERILASYDERNSLGLLNMQEQAKLLDGGLTIVSPSPRLGKGTLVKLRVPYKRVRKS